VAEWLRVLLAPGQVVELRAVKVKRGSGRPHTQAGYFDSEHLEAMAAVALQLTNVARGCYFTLNPLHPDLLARCCNRTDYAEEGSLSKDKDVTRRTRLLVDSDPQRDAQVSATDEEKAKALEVILAARAWLRERNWPEPTLLDSGNGFHAVFGLDLPADDGGLVERVLKALAKKFDTEHVKIDQAVYNASRIVKIPGTLARKGDSTQQRPHRRSCLLEAPATLAPVPRELLEGLVLDQLGPDTPAPKPAAAPSGPKPAAGDRPRLLVDRWLQDRNVAYRVKARPDGRGRTIYILKECPFDSSHADPDACVMQDGAGKLYAKCLHDSCSGRGWQAFRDKIGRPDPHHYDPPLSAATRGQGRRGAAIILDYFREHYKPVFKRGNVVHCGDGAALPQGVACGVPDSPLIERLAHAADVPRTAEGGVKWGALPKFFTTWGKVAWGDLLAALPDEDAAALDGEAPAGEEFRRLVKEALLSEVVLGETIRGTHVTQTERRSLVDWCGKFAKAGPWRSVRSKRCWCRLESAGEDEVRLQIAIRHELFSQLKADRRLVDMSPATFARRAKRYGVGSSTRDERPHGMAAVVLDPDFVAELTASGPPHPEQPAGPPDPPPAQRDG
jgi:hypothetical protein